MEKISNINIDNCHARIQQNQPSIFVNWQENGQKHYEFFKLRYEAEIFKDRLNLRRLLSMTAPQLADEYHEKYGISAKHQDYNTLVAALYYGKRIKFLTQTDITDIIKKYPYSELTKPSI
jgi:hypothetical protein